MGQSLKQVNRKLLLFYLFHCDMAAHKPIYDSVLCKTAKYHTRSHKAIMLAVKKTDVNLSNDTITFRWISLGSYCNRDK